MAKVISYGAAEVVTGSCHLLELENGKRLLIDCGMFQGREEERNYQAFGFDPASVDYLLVTHAHLDHVGRIPKLVKEGFNGLIVTTDATRDLSAVIMMDSAKIMKEDYLTLYKKAERKGKEDEVPLPLYEEEDVRNVFSLKHRICRYDKAFELCEGVTVTYRNAGHILGSAFIEIDYKEGEERRTIVFSGDIGNDNRLVLPDLASCEKADYLYVESTYGDRNHKSTLKSVKEFKDVILSTLDNWGNVIIPSFAIERTQEILCILKAMYDKGQLPECKVYLDSPMATKTTAIYRKYAEELLSEECQDIKKRDGTVFDFAYLNYTRNVDESKAINDEKYRTIIIAGSGMCTGGRILHHFKNRLWNRKNAVIFVGYQAEGSLGRKIVDGAEWVKIYHEEIKVQAEIHTINGFSAHADQSGILDWVRNIQDLKRIFLIHGEEDKQEVLREVMGKELHEKAHIVAPEEVISLP